MGFRDLTFQSPLAAYLMLLVIPLLLLQLYLYRYRQKQIHLFTTPHLLSKLLIGRSKGITISKMVGLSLAWILICFAMMDPVGNLRYRSLGGKPQETTTHEPRLRPHEVIFLVDTSASMLVPDGPNGQTRLDQAKEIMEDIVRQLKGPTISLYAFTSVLTPVVPPTMDYLFLRLMIKSLHLNMGDVGGTLYEPVLKDLAKKVFLQPSEKLYSLIILSDGGDTNLESLQGEARQKAIQSILDIIPNPQDLHLRVMTIGIGSNTPHQIPHVTFEGKPVESKLDPEILEELAAKERGTYFPAQDQILWNLSQAVVEKINQDPLIEQNEPMLERKVVSAKPSDIIYDLYFQVPLGLAIVLLLLIFILPDVRKVFLLFILLSPTFANAQDTIFQAGEEARAYAQANDFEQAASGYEKLLKRPLPKWQQSLVYYDLGTLYLLEKQWDKALHYFELVPQEAITSPWLLRDLEMNRGVAFYNKAQTLLKTDLEEADELAHSSLHQFNLADALDCLTYRLDLEGAPLIACPSSTESQLLLNETQNLLNEIELNHLSQLTQSHGALLLLIEGIKQLIHVDKESNTYHDYIVYQGMRLIPLWESLKKSIPKEQKQVEKWQALFQYSLKGDMKGLDELLAQLQSFDTSKPIKGLILHYRLLLNTDPLSKTALTSLSEIQKKIFPNETAAHYLDSAKETLQQDKSFTARFYLTAALNLIEDSLIDIEKNQDPLSVLNAALRRARRAFQLNRLRNQAKSEAAQLDPLNQIVNEAQQTVLQSTQPFITAVLAQEEKNFHKKESPQQCQQSPWDQAIPLFDLGTQEAEEAKLQLSQQPYQRAFNSQKGTIKHWEAVLSLLKNSPSPPSSSPQQKPEPNTQPIDQAPKNPNEVLRLIQEMQLEDQPQKVEEQKELHSW